jgi:hypothetical protein
MDYRSGSSTIMLVDGFVIKYTSSSMYICCITSQSYVPDSHEYALVRTCSGWLRILLSRLQLKSHVQFVGTRENQGRIVNGPMRVAWADICTVLEL